MSKYAGVRRAACAALLASTFFLQTSASADGRLPRSSPEAQGVPSCAVSAFLDSVMSLPTAEVHHVMVLRHGNVIGEAHPAPFRPTDGHTLFSCSKTFTAAAVGLAIRENRLRIDDRVAAFFPEALPEGIPSRLADLTIYDLLTMRAGFAPSDSVRAHCDEWVKACLGRSQVARPGDVFAYDSMDTYLLSAIVSRVSGMPVLEYLRPRLFEPLGINDARWECSPEGVSCGGWGLHMTVESMAKFGQCLLRGGEFGGRQVLPREWVRDMMSIHVDERGYGLQMWSCAHPGAMRADGAYGQFIIVMPEEDMVCAITQCITSAEPGNEEQRLLFSNIAANATAGPLPESKCYKTLRRKEGSYGSRPAAGRGSSRMVPRGTALTLRLEPNKLGWRSIDIAQGDGLMTIGVTDSLSRRVTMKCASNGWARSLVPTTFPPHPRGFTRGAYSGFAEPFAVAGSYGWSPADTLRLRLMFVDWISGLEMTIHLGAAKEAEVQVKCNYEKSPFTTRATVE